MRILCGAALGMALFATACVPVPLIVAVAGGIGTAVDTYRQVRPALQLLHDRLAGTKTLEDKADAFKAEYCARPALRAEAREDLEAALIAQGVPAPFAKAWVDFAKAKADSACAEAKT